MTSLLGNFTIFKDKLFWADFSKILYTFQCVNGFELEQSPSKSLERNFYSIFGKTMCTYFNSPGYKCHRDGLVAYFELDKANAASNRKCTIRQGAEIPVEWCLRSTVVDLFHVVEEMNSSNIPKPTLGDTYDKIVDSIYDLIYDWRYSLIFGDELNAILSEAYDEVQIEWAQEQERLAAVRLSQAPFSERYTRKLVQELDIFRKCEVLAAQALNFITAKCSEMRVGGSLNLMDTIYRLCGDYFYSKIDDGNISTTTNGTTERHIDTKIVDSLALVLNELKSNGRRTGEDQLAHKLILRACSHSSLSISSSSVCSRLGVRRWGATANDNISSKSLDSDDESTAYSGSESAENEERLDFDNIQNDLYDSSNSGDEADESDDEGGICDPDTDISHLAKDSVIASGGGVTSNLSKKREHHLSSVFKDIRNKASNSNKRDLAAAAAFWHSSYCSMINTNGHPVGIRDSKGKPDIHQSCTQQLTDPECYEMWKNSVDYENHLLTYPNQTISRTLLCEQSVHVYGPRKPTIVPTSHWCKCKNC